MLEPIQDNDNYKPHAKIIQIYPCLLKLLRKQESVTDGQTDKRTARQTDGRLLLLYPLTTIAGG
jgi:hypothetical protein